MATRQDLVLWCLTAAGAGCSWEPAFTFERGAGSYDGGLSGVVCDDLERFVTKVEWRMAMADPNECSEWER